MRRLLLLSVVLGCSADPPTVDRPEHIPTAAPREPLVANEFGRAFSDASYWYRIRCLEDCDTRDSLGPPYYVERVDRTTGRRAQIGDTEYGIAAITLFEDNVYIGVYGHQITPRGVFRIPKAGGHSELVWDGDKIDRLETYRDGVLAIGSRSVVWITSRETRLVYSGQRIGAAVVDGDEAFIAELGSSWGSKNDGSIRRVSLRHADERAALCVDRPNTISLVRAGADTPLVGTLRGPTALTTHGDTLFFTLRASDEIWSVPKQGGPVALFVPHDPTGRACECNVESQRMSADEHGLFWWRTERFFSDGGTLYFRPWKSIASDAAIPMAVRNSRAAARL